MSPDVRWLEAVEVLGRIYLLPVGTLAGWDRNSVTQLHYRANIVLDAEGRVLKHRTGSACGSTCQL